MYIVKMFGYEKALARIWKIDAGLIDMRIPNKLMLKKTEERFKKTFKKGGDKKWKSLSPVTLKLREVNKRNQPLIDRGNILRALTQPRSRYASHKVFKRSFRLAIKSNLKNNGVFYPAIMDQGKTINDGWGKGIEIKIPARQFMHLIEQDRKNYQKIMHVYMEGLVRA